MPSVTRTRTHRAAALREYRRQPSGDRVVRIPLGPRQRLYAYVCAGARLGSLVRVNAPISGRVTVTVVALGRGHYNGPLKRATLIHR